MATIVTVGGLLIAPGIIDGLLWIWLRVTVFPPPISGAYALVGHVFLGPVIVIVFVASFFTTRIVIMLAAWAVVLVGLLYVLYIRMAIFGYL